MRKIQKCGYFKEPYQQCIKADSENKKEVLFKHRGKLIACDDEIYEQIKNESDAIRDAFFEKRIDELLE